MIFSHCLALLLTASANVSCGDLDNEYSSSSSSSLDGNRNFSGRLGGCLKIISCEVIPVAADGLEFIA